MRDGGRVVVYYVMGMGGVVVVFGWLWKSLYCITTRENEVPYNYHQFQCLPQRVPQP